MPAFPKDVTAAICSLEHDPDEYLAMGTVVEVTEMALRVILQPFTFDVALLASSPRVSVWIPRTLLRARPCNEVHDYPDRGKLVVPMQFARARYFPGTLEKKEIA